MKAVSASLSVLCAAGLLAACQTTPPPSSNATSAKPAPAPVVQPPKPTVVGPARVALLLPMSGRHAALGDGLRRAAMALDEPNDNIQVTVYDTKGTPEGAVAAYTAARGADAIVGPVFSASARALIPLTGGTLGPVASPITPAPTPSTTPPAPTAPAPGNGTEAGTGTAPQPTAQAPVLFTPVQYAQVIPAAADPTTDALTAPPATAAPLLAGSGPVVLALTNDQSVAGGAIKVLGHSPQPQVTKLLSHLAGKGRRQVALLGPDTVYARLVANEIKAMAAAGKLTLAVESLYAPGTQYADVADLTRSVARSGADVIVVPSGGLNLVGVSSLLQYYNAIPSAVIAGTDVWESGTNLLREASLLGAMFASTTRGKADPAMALGGVPPMIDPSAAAPETAGAANAAAPDIPPLSPPEPQETPVSGTSAGANATPAPAADASAGTPEDGALPDLSLEEDDAFLPPPPMPTDPDKFQQLVMDGVALVKSWAGRPGSSTPRPPLATWLANPAGFDGAAGLFRFNAQGAAERAYNVLRIERAGLITESPALVRFAGAPGAPIRLPRTMVPPPGMVSTAPITLGTPSETLSSPGGAATSTPQSGPVSGESSSSPAPSGSSAPPLRTGPFKPSFSL